MRSSTAAKRYARALFSIAQEDDAIAKLRDQLGAFAALFDSEPALRKALFRPLHPVAERRSVLRAVAGKLGVEDVLRNFLVFLIDQRRLVDFDGIRAEFDRLADAAAGRVTARVTTAAPLDTAQRERLQRALATRTGREVELDVAVDPDLIGGAIAVVDNVVYDGSLKTQLSQLRDTLAQGR